MAGLAVGSLQGPEGHHFYIQPTRIRAFQAIRGVIEVSREKFANDSVDDFRIDQWAVGRDAHDEICLLLLRRMVVTVEDIALAAAKTENSLALTEFYDRIVLCFVSSRDNYITQALGCSGSLNHPSEHGPALNLSQHFPRKA
jgi:hypothetical protein